jgi:hypothetical protein
MIALGRSFVICALAGLLAGCGAPAIFEDVGDDPHPPEFTLLGIAVQPPGDPLPFPDFLPPATTVTVRPFDTATSSIALLGEYRDVGGDADVVVWRDLGIGPESGASTAIGTVRVPEKLSVAPRGARREAEANGDPDPNGDPVGTSGRVWLILTFAPMVEGIHRLEIWVEDTKGSRSAKTPFTVNVQLF